MYISSFKIVNFKSFRETQAVPLRPGFNIVVGQNDAGKSSLAEALSARFADRPHRSLDVAPERRSPLEAVSTCELEYHLDEGDILKLLKSKGPFSFPLKLEPRSEAEFRKYMAEAARSGTFRVQVRGGGVILTYGWEHNPQNPFMYANARYSPREGGFERCNEAGSPYLSIVADALQQRVYVFRAERLHVSSGAITDSPRLEPDARNLAGVLNLLQSGNVSRFRRFCSAVNMIFPHVRQITVPPTGGSTAQIYVWSVDPESERDDLAIPLAESGTGIGQVLAILYVVLTSDEPRTIVIDEPQSFLHPGAVRKLIGILQLFPQHQYVITTHSPSVVTAAGPDQLLLVRRGTTESEIEVLDPRQNSQVQTLLSEVGARLADVFGADDILWVEGQTEEICFPLIVRKLLNRPLLGTEILAILNTGDLEGRHARVSLEIYRRLSQGRGLLPPAIGFILDREQRSDKEMRDLSRMSGERTYFTPRRMYENYLLLPAAVAAVVSGIEDFRESAVPEAEVSRWIDNHRWEQKYFGFQVQPPDRTDEFWIANVHGAKVLKDLFEELSDHRVAFEKTRHSLALTEWLLEHSPSDLQDIAQLLTSALDVADSTRTLADP